MARLSCSLPWLACALCLFAPLDARADTLALIVDETAETAFWWGGDGAGDCVENLLAERADLVGGQNALGRAAISRVYQRPDITPSNAANLGVLLGVDTVVLGRVTQQGGSQAPWTGRSRAELVLDVVLLDSATGASRGAVSMSAVSFAPYGEDALARACRTLGRDLAVQQSRASFAVASELPRPSADLVVYPSGQAAPYVALRGALRAAHEGVADVVERWASEGAIGVTFSLVEGYEAEEVHADLLNLGRLTLPSGGLAALEEVEGQLVVRLASVPGGGADAP